MGAKNYFEKQKQNIIKLKGLNKQSRADFLSEVESAKYVEEFFEEKDTFVPDLDYSDPANFVKYGSALAYYDNAFSRVRTQYPYDGSQAEKLEFYNALTPFEQYIYNKEYPKSTGFVEFGVPSGSWDSAGAPASFGTTNTPQYIRFYGGPHEGNVINEDKNQENNLEFFYSHGVTIEFWMKKDEWVPLADTQWEAIFNLRNDQDTQRFWIYIEQGSTSTMRVQHNDWSTGVPLSVATVQLDTGLTDIADGNWHHYAFAMSNVDAANNRFKLFVDGNCVDDVTEGVGTPVFSITGSLIGTVAGAGGANPGAPINIGEIETLAGSGKLSGSIDDFRFWKSTRTSKEIGLNYFRPIAGGTNTDTSKYFFSSSLDNNPVDLGVYLKFNEGITGNDTTDSVILDYSGRDSNGTFTGYSGSLDMRNVGSAMVLSSVAEAENPDPILYSTNPNYTSKLTALQLSGSHYDFTNNAYLYNMLPRWIIEDDESAALEIKSLLQIMGSYFDTLHAQISELTKIKQNRYSIYGNKQTDIGFKLLNSLGFDISELFINSDVLQTIFEQDEKRVFSDKLYDLKNKIYKNIYNNLAYIYKSKGTENSFRSLFRCFGTDDEIFKINLYSSLAEYEIKDNPYSTYTKKNLIDFSGISHSENRDAVIFQYCDSTPDGKYGYFPSSSNVNVPFTVEAEIVFPKVPDIATFASTLLLESASLFGVHSSSLSHTDTTIPATDADFQVYSVKEGVGEQFVLTSSTGFFPTLASPVFVNDNNKIYDNLRWNLAVRIRPVGEEIPTSQWTYGESRLEFYGAKVHLGEVLEEFEVTASTPTWTVASASQFLTDSNKRFYIGAHRTNVTGAVLTQTDIRFSRFMVWNDYVGNEQIKYHARDPRNFGRNYPYRNAFVNELNPRPPAASTPIVSTTYIPQADTLALNWEFSTITTASAAGIVQNVLDSTSGSTADVLKYPLDNYGNVAGRNYLGEGRAFAASEDARQLGFLPTNRIQRPDSLYSEDQVQVLSRDDTTKQRYAQPSKHFFAVEASMYEVISRNLLHYFDSVIAFNNLIGEPANKYRTTYKNLDYLRRLLFNKIDDVALLDKFVSLYKFLDNALDSVLANLIPASAGAADQVRTIVENHTLERNKYIHKLNFLWQNYKNTAEAMVAGSTAGTHLQGPEENATYAFDPLNVDVDQIIPPFYSSQGRNVFSENIFNVQERAMGTPIMNPARVLSITQQHDTVGSSFIKSRGREEAYRGYQGWAEITNTPADGTRGNANQVGLQEVDRAPELVGVVGVDTNRAQLNLNRKFEFARNRALSYSIRGIVGTNEEDGVSSRQQTFKVGNITNRHSDTSTDGIRFALRPITRIIKDDIPRYGLREFQSDSFVRDPTIALGTKGSRYSPVKFMEGVSSVPASIAPKGSGVDFFIVTNRRTNMLQSPFIEAIPKQPLETQNNLRKEDYNISFNVSVPGDDPQIFYTNPQILGDGLSVLIFDANNRATNLVRERHTSINMKYRLADNTHAGNWDGDPARYLWWGHDNYSPATLIQKGGFNFTFSVDNNIENPHTGQGIPDRSLVDLATSSSPRNTLNVINRTGGFFRHRYDLTNQFSPENTLIYSNLVLKRALHREFASHGQLGAGDSNSLFGPGSATTHKYAARAYYQRDKIHTGSLRIRYDNGFHQWGLQNSLTTRWVEKGCKIRKGPNGALMVPALYSAEIPDLMDEEWLFTPYRDNEIKLIEEGENNLATSVPFGNIKPDFVGLNTFIYDAYDSTTRTLTPSVNPDVTCPDHLVLNAILLNRNAGPWPYPSWRQVRHAETKPLRNRKVLIENSFFPRLDNARIQTYREDIDQYFYYDYSMMFNKSLSNVLYFRKGRRNFKTTWNYGLGQTEIYDESSNRFIDLNESGIVKYDLSDNVFNKMMLRTAPEFARIAPLYWDYAETIYPRSQIQYLKKSKELESIDTLINWPSLKTTRAIALETNDLGFQLHTTDVNPLSPNISSSPLETNTVTVTAPDIVINNGQMVVFNSDEAYTTLGVADVPYEDGYLNWPYGHNIRYTTIPESDIYQNGRKAFESEEEWGTTKRMAQQRALISEYRSHDYIQQHALTPSSGTSISVYGRTDSLETLLANYSYSDQVFSPPADLPLKKANELLAAGWDVKYEIECDALVKFRPYKEAYWQNQLPIVGNMINQNIFTHLSSSGTDFTKMTGLLPLARMAAIFFQKGALGPTPYIGENQSSASVPGPFGPQASPLAAYKLPYMSERALWDDGFLPSLWKDSRGLNSTASLAASKTAGTSSMRYSTITSRAAQQLLIESERFYNIKGAHFVGKPADSCRAGEWHHEMDGPVATASSGVGVTYEMNLVFNRDAGFNNTTIGDLWGEYPYIQYMVPWDGMPTASWDSVNVWSYEGGATNFITPADMYKQDAAVLNISWTPTQNCCESVTWSRVMKEASFKYYKLSLAAQHGTGSAINQGNDLRNWLAWETGPSGEVVVGPKMENISAILNTSGTISTTGGGTSWNHACVGMNYINHPFAEGTPSTTKGSDPPLGITFSIHGPEWSDGVQADDGSKGNLAELFGLAHQEPKTLGDFEGTAVEEAIMAIPIDIDDCKETKYFDLSMDHLLERLIYGQLKGRWQYEYFGKKEVDLWAAQQDMNKIDENWGIYDDWINFHEKYCIPPELDSLADIRENIKKGAVSLRNGRIQNVADTITPALSLFFEYSQRFDPGDLINHWQMVNPEKDIEFVKQKISVDARIFGKNIPEKWRMMFFKVKKRAEVNIKNYRDRKYGTTPYKKSDEGVNYNWPYDYFTLINYASINAKIVCALPRTPPQEGG